MTLQQACMLLKEANRVYELALSISLARLDTVLENDIYMVRFKTAPNFKEDLSLFTYFLGECDY
jgi:hypothetical protein